MWRNAEITGASPPERKLTEPLGCAVLTLLALSVTLVAFFSVVLPWEADASIFGFGHGPVCANVPFNGITVSGSGSGVVLAHIRAGASSFAGQLGLCVNRPTLGQRVLVTLTQAPAVVLWTAVLLLLWRLLRAVRTAGPFDLRISRRLRFLGWFVLAGSLAVQAGQAAAVSRFTATVVTDQVPMAGNMINAVVNALITPLLIACGLLTLARIMRAGAQMNDDLAGTV